ncbi:MAG: NADH-quinone oxidoreductase subunit N [Bacteroidetes bacterium]|nr:NADH-quinone oxidoreductase subunit N [Bacteroidota bacterium]
MVTETILQQLVLFVPELILTGTFCLILLTGAFTKLRDYGTSTLTLIGSIAAFISVLPTIGVQKSLFAGMIAIDSFAVFFKLFSLVCLIGITLFSLHAGELKLVRTRSAEYYALLVAMTLGMFLMASATHLLMMVLAMELTSLSAYVLAGYTKEAADSSEASLKYILYGAVASGLLLYGISILYGLTGSLHYTTINHVLAVEPLSRVPLALVFVLLLVGFGFKISAVPFHSWTPDVYEGAPITITTFLSVASKAAGFAMLIRFFKLVCVNPVASVEAGYSIPLLPIDWQLLLAVLAVLTMTVGNLVALWQENLKRLLAYSSIAHAGYMLIGVVSFTDKGIASVLVYLVVYLFMNMGAFLVVMVVANKTGSEDIRTYRGLGSRSPFLAIAMTVFLISLTGIPPTAGFIGKLYLFAAALDAQWYWLAFLGVLNSVLALYYYVRIIRNMFLRESESAVPNISLTSGEVLLLGALLVPTLVFGIFFSPIVEIAQKSIVMLGVP